MFRAAVLQLHSFDKDSAYQELLDDRIGYPFIRKGQ